MSTAVDSIPTVVGRYPLVLGQKWSSKPAARSAASPPPAPTPANASSWRRGAGKATLLALFVIAFNVALSQVSLALARSGLLPTDTLVSIALVLGLAFYGIVGWAAVKSLGGDPLVWSIEAPVRGVLMGVLRGSVMAGVVLGAQ